jgi:hypothetical protein
MPIRFTPGVCKTIGTRDDDVSDGATRRKCNCGAVVTGYLVDPQCDMLASSRTCYSHEVIMKPGLGAVPRRTGDWWTRSTARPDAGTWSSGCDVR